LVKRTGPLNGLEKKVNNIRFENSEGLGGKAQAVAIL